MSRNVSIWRKISWLLIGFLLTPSGGICSLVGVIALFGSQEASVVLASATILILGIGSICFGVFNIIRFGMTFQQLGKQTPPPISQSIKQVVEQCDNSSVKATVATPERKKNPPKKLSTPALIDSGRIDELRSLNSLNFDLTKLVKLCEELNKNYADENYLAVAMLTRSIIDHVPPIFGCKSFGEVANNYSGGSKSFKQSMLYLENSSRKVGDAHLHSQIRSKEILPNKTQVNYSNDLDVLLAEIVRILK